MRVSISAADDNRRSRLWHFLFLGLFFLSGISGLTYEVLWVRQFTSVFGALASAVTIVLTSFMFGLGIGAWLVGKVADALTEKLLERTYMLLEIGIGSYSLCLPALLSASERAYIHFYQLYQPSPLIYYSRP